MQATGPARLVLAQGPEPTKAAGGEATLPQVESDDFVACYHWHYARLVRALELAGAPHPTAEDHAQEAFARMLARWHRVRRGPNPAGYAYRIAFRLWARGRMATVGVSLPGDGGATESPDTGVANRLAALTALTAMPARRRACAVACLVVGFSTSDAAHALGIAEGTVRKHLADARADLRAVLADEDGDQACC